MLPASDEIAVFDSCQQSVVGDHGGKFAVVCGRRLVGIHASLDLALEAAIAAFSDGDLAEGTPVLINELGEAASVRVVAVR